METIHAKKRARVQNQLHTMGIRTTTFKKIVKHDGSLFRAFLTRGTINGNRIVTRTLGGECALRVIPTIRANNKGVGRDNPVVLL